MAEKALIDSCGWLQNFSSLGSIEEIQSGLIAFIAQKGLKNGQVLWPMRVALTGEQFSPGVFEVIWVLGKEECLKRLKNGLAGHFGKSV
jgi:glutamyl-tRNA synthetase